MTSKLEEHLDDGAASRRTLLRAGYHTAAVYLIACLFFIKGPGV